MSESSHDSAVNVGGDKSLLCEPGTCPHDPKFEHDNYFGCIPKDFSQATGRSKTHHQTKGADGRYRWNGGCNGR